MRRREFVALLGCASVAWPLAASAQQRAEPVIGFLNGRSPTGAASVLAEFHRGLADAGYVEGKNVTVEYRWAEGRYDRLPVLAAELVARRVAAIAATGGSVAGLAAKAATSTIPVVFLCGPDPVEAGLVANLSRPGGNVTGITLFITELGGKRLELLRELVPKAAKVAVLANPSYPTAMAEAREAQARASALGLEVHVFNAAAEKDLEPAFTAISAQRTEALLVANDPFLIDLRDGLVRMAAEHAVPALYFAREFTEAGGLMSYGASIGDGYHKVGLYTGQILKGAQPGDLPVQQPTAFELLVNLKTAAALGITVPPSLLARADEVIE